MLDNSGHPSGGEQVNAAKISNALNLWRSVGGLPDGGDENRPIPAKALFIRHFY
jgi:hypothetical protein